MTMTTAAVSVMASGMAADDMPGMHFSTIIPGADNFSSLPGATSAFGTIGDERMF